MGWDENNGTISMLVPEVNSTEYPTSANAM
jgi:hypothetical protein